MIFEIFWELKVDWRWDGHIRWRHDGLYCNLYNTRSGTVIQHPTRYCHSQFRITNKFYKPATRCFNVKFSSWNFLPYMDLPPVPLWFVKSPPWHIYVIEVKETKLSVHFDLVHEPCTIATSNDHHTVQVYTKILAV